MVFAVMVPEQLAPVPRIAAALFVVLLVRQSLPRE